MKSVISPGCAASERDDAETRLTAGDVSVEYESHDTGAAAAATDDDLYSLSPAMREVMGLVARAASMRAGVLIRGEEDTGRQVVARAIHTLQNGSPGAFVAVNCAEDDSEALDISLFGKAAWSQRRDGPPALEHVSRHGALYAALDGTIYLQNVEEAPLRVQARLARVLRDREFVLAESGEAIGFDIRPMAGVDPGFDRAVTEGRVREDLYRRLSALRIEMPPLRSRREDIPALANSFLREICASLRVPPKTLSRPALSLISALPWRGNAAELRTMLEGLATGLQDSNGIGIEDVLAHVRLDGGSTVSSGGGTLKQARARFEREYIGSVLERHHGRMGDAAKALGIQRTNLYRKLRTLHVNGGRRRV